MIPYGQINRMSPILFKDACSLDILTVCVKILVDHVSALVESLRTAIDGKNAVAADLVHDAA